MGRTHPAPVGPGDEYDTERAKHPLSPEMKKAIDDFMAKKTIACGPLCARMTPAACVARQLRMPVEKLSPGVRVVLYNTPADKYCRSGECGAGKIVREELGLVLRNSEEKTDANTAAD